ncbi:anaphase promoting complex subunit 8 [Tricharina praecox]|uniref:anaphase promoting complex subunit 8 n=1 Tax=Tricharina praecox TaxID=43433 RepID=UPI00221E68C5|nr:anaphase promoting complex subunit 8 [Tricharina praecox]KAI5854374.1 anaphase promoting complex subunit 8 [Tricharina praecox]
MATEIPEPHQLQSLLQTAMLKCSERCLYQSAKWAAELLTSMDVPPPSAETSVALPQAYLHPMSADTAELALETVEFNQYLLAKSYFDVHEYDRASFVLQNCKSSKARFLHLYARYIAGEKRRDEDSEMVLGPLDGAETRNKEVAGILTALEEIFAEKDGDTMWGEDDSWLLFLYGIVLQKQKNEEEARGALLKSVNLYPYNWSAWQELGATIGTLTDLNTILPSLPANIMTNLFVLSTNQELYQTADPIHSQLSDLLNLFPGSSWLKTQRALLYYHARDFEEAESIFDSLIKIDPHRIDALDHYSNILYVMERRPKLGFIAQLASSTDKFRPETCCVIGNYYSLKSEHEKAVMYFRRALTLDRTFLSAWTLMGHEYVEMKNTHAAIEAYRRAVDVNRRDYRAWYGLGLSYEVLEMHYYALFYFQRAAALRPYDSQMWQAMGQCFDRMNRPTEAIKSFKRALISLSPSAAGGHDPQILYLIATMYEKLRNSKEAAKWMEACMAEEENSGVTGVTGQARLWLARWAFVSSEWNRAMQLAEELAQDGQEVEEAKALIRDLRAREAREAR